MLTILGPTEGKIIAVKIIENITHEDYSKLLPLLNHKVSSNGEAFFYMEMEEFELEAFQSFWEEMKFDTSHFCNFSKIALVGNRDLEIPRMDIVIKFGFREVRYYGPSEKIKALSWLSDQVEIETPSRKGKVLGN